MKKIAIAFLRTVGVMCCLAGLVLILLSVLSAFGQTVFSIVCGVTLFITIFIGVYKMSNYDHYD